LGLFAPPDTLIATFYLTRPFDVDSYIKREYNSKRAKVSFASSYQEGVMAGD
jgi:hypothetical protein